MPAKTAPAPDKAGAESTSPDTPARVRLIDASCPPREPAALATPTASVGTIRLHIQHQHASEDDHFLRALEAQLDQCVWPQKIGHPRTTTLAP